MQSLAAMLLCRLAIALLYPVYLSLCFALEVLVRVTCDRGRSPRVEP